MIIWLSCAVTATAPAHADDPVASLKRFSNFTNVDLNRLKEGEILSQRGPLMKFPNGISSQICFFVPIPPEEMFRQLKTWDPTTCGTVKVYASGTLKNPCELKEFKKLQGNPGNYPVKWLLEKTLATTPGESDLNLSRSEMREISGCVGKDQSPAAVSSCWAKFLFERAAAFQVKGLAGVLPYENGEVPISPAVQIRTLLQEQAKITQEFAPILQKAGILNGGAGDSSLQPTYNWGFFDANHHATLNLGAVYQLAVGDHYQLLDMDYYASSTYYVAATLYEIWPIRDGNKTGSLVWRGDFLAAPMLRYTKGIERIAFGAIMIIEVKKFIRCFKDEIRTNP